jgi:cytochrome c556
MPWEGFVEGTADVKGSEAKAAIWDNRADFDKLSEQLQERTAALAEAAAGGAERQAVGKAFKRVGETCKSCHDDFKQDD